MLGLAVHAVWPLKRQSGVLVGVIGAGSVALGVALFIAAIWALHVAGKPVPGNEPTTTIVQSGPYRLSRNPIYLAFALIQLGIALWIGSLWLIATLGIAFVVISLIVVPREERYLETLFATEYLLYKANVRRWL